MRALCKAAAWPGKLRNAAPIQQFRNCVGLLGSLVTYVPLIRLSPKVSNAIEQAVKAGCGAAVNIRDGLHSGP